MAVHCMGRYPCGSIKRVFPGHPLVKTSPSIQKEGSDLQGSKGDADVESRLLDTVGKERVGGIERVA